MSEINFRQGATQVERAAFNSSMVKVVSAETILIAAGVGLSSHSLTWGLAVFFGMIIAFNVPRLRALLAGLLSVGWGVFGYFFVSKLSTEVGAPLIAAVVGLVLGVAVHACFFQWQTDYGSAK